jgi:hypothetical protein
LEFDFSEYAQHAGGVGCEEQFRQNFMVLAQSGEAGKQM